MKIFEPYRYQTTCMDFLEANPRSGLFLEMGLGKTAIVLHHIKQMIYDNLEVQRVLVVAPLRVATVAWPTELEKWRSLQNLTYFVLHGEQRIEEPPDVDITIMNYEGAKWLINVPDLWKRFDMVVYDESTFLKNSGTKRWRYMFRMFDRCKRIVLLTGTPVPNGLKDLWGQIYLLDKGKRLYPTQGQFYAEYFWRDYYRPNLFRPVKGSLEKITEKISDIAMTLKVEDYIDMPEMIINEVDVKLPKQVTDLYRQLEKELLTGLSDGTEIVVFNASALTSKLRQLVQGFVYDESKAVHRVHDVKVDALKEIMESNPGEPILVASEFVAEIDYLHKVFPNSRTVYGKTNARDSAESIALWNEGKLDLLIAHPASLGHGINLQYGGSIIVWMGATWNLEFWKQFNARLHRNGQKKTVVINVLTALGTVDVSIVDALKDKDTTQKSVLKKLIELREKGGSDCGQSEGDRKGDSDREVFERALREAEVVLRKVHKPKPEGRPGPNNNGEQRCDCVC